MIQIRTFKLTKGNFKAYMILLLTKICSASDSKEFKTTRSNRMTLSEECPTLKILLRTFGLKFVSWKFNTRLLSSKSFLTSKLTPNNWFKRPVNLSISSKIPWRKFLVILPKPNKKWRLSFLPTRIREILSRMFWLHTLKSSVVWKDSKVIWRLRLEKWISLRSDCKNSRILIPFQLMN